MRKNSELRYMPEGIIAIASGNAHTLILTSLRRVFAFGSNQHGQIDPFNQSDRYFRYPTELPIPEIGQREVISSMHPSNDFTLLLTSRGRVLSFGQNNQGQLGVSPPLGQEPGSINQSRSFIGSSYNNRRLLNSNRSSRVNELHFSELERNERISRLSVGINHVLALSDRGKVFGWGQNDQGQLGDNNHPQNGLPFSLINLGLQREERVEDILALNNLSILLTSRGNIIQLGQNGQLVRELWIRSLLPGERPLRIFGRENLLLVLTNMNRIYEQSFNQSRRMYVTTQRYGLYQNSRENQEPSARFINIPFSTDEEYIQDVSTSGTHSIVVTNIGRVFGWGVNSHGELGLFNQAQPITTPQFVNIQRLLPQETIFAVTCGEGTSLLLTNQGRLLVCGDNNDGQLGIDSQNPTVTSPTLLTIQGLRSGAVYRDITSSRGSNYAITEQLEVVTWGLNNYGQLGDGTTINRMQPGPIRFPLQSSENVQSVFAGDHHAFAISTRGRVFGWGYNQFGQLGDHTNLQRNQPTLITFSNMQAQERVVEIAAGESHTLFLTNLHRIFATGNNDHGQCGDNSTISKNLPTLVKIISLPANDQIIHIYAGLQHSLCLTNGGSVYSWGNNFHGQCGGASIQLLTPTRVLFEHLLPNERIISLASGQYHNHAITSQRRIFAWGRNDYHQLGDRTREYRYTPVLLTLDSLPMQNDEFLIGVSNGENHSLLFTNFGSIWGWGSGLQGQINLNNTQNTISIHQSPQLIFSFLLNNLDSIETVTKVVSNHQHNFVLTSIGRIHHWGELT